MPLYTGYVGLDFRITLKLLFFILGFTLIFFAVHFYNLLPDYTLTENLASIPWLFSAISVIFSIISGFVIQTKWQMWDRLIEASQKELNTLKHLFRMSDHFSEEVSRKLKKNIHDYITVILKESNTLDQKGQTVQKEFEDAVYLLEETLIDASKKFPESGVLSTTLREAVENQEYIIQNTNHRLPFVLRVLITFSTFSIIVASLFIGVSNVLYDYLFTLVIALLAYGIYLIIDDLDHPYRPGNWHLSMDPYREFLAEIKKKLPKES